MFGFLKDKLKSWVKKAAPEEQKEELEIVEIEKPKPLKVGKKIVEKTSKKSLEKPTKKGKKEKIEKSKKGKGKKGKTEEKVEEEKLEFLDEKPEIIDIEMPLETPEEKEERVEEEKAILEKLDKKDVLNKEIEMPKEEHEKELQRVIETPIEKEIEMPLEIETPEEKEEKDKKEGSISKVKSFFGFGKKKKEEELLLDIEDKAEKIEVERKISNQIWQDIEKEKKNIEENEQKEKSILSFFKTSFSQEKFEELWPELEMGLLQSNIAYKVVDEIKNQLQCKLVNQKVSEKDVHGIFKNIISELLMEPPNIIKEIKSKIKEKKPFVIIFVGINGSGKTTNMAKFAHLLKKENISCCMAAADTFRSAAIEQLQTHSETLNVPFIKKDYGSDPASVGFDAITYAKKHALDVVLIDTAGRMQTKDSLMKEMEKIVRVCNPDMKIFVGESITGNDATEQAQAFNEAINLDGIILSKADVDEKGGTAISVSFITKKPILFLGTGQKYDDLEIFSKEKILKSLGL